MTSSCHWHLAAALHVFEEAASRLGCHGLGGGFAPSASQFGNGTRTLPVARWQLECLGHALIVHKFPQPEAYPTFDSGEGLLPVVIDRLGVFA
jgi:hypothetical protein